MNFLERIFHKHKWSYNSLVNEIDRDRIDSPSILETRECGCCGKKQILESNCLGLNPPEFYEEWVTQ